VVKTAILFPKGKELLGITRQLVSGIKTGGKNFLLGSPTGKTLVLPV